VAVHLNGQTATSFFIRSGRGGCLSTVMSRKEVARSGKEVAVHHNGQTATSFPLRATSFLFILMDRQPPLFRVNEARSGGGCEKKGGCLSIKMNSHLFHFVPSTVMGAANSPKEVAVATSIDSSHLFPSTSCLRTPWADLVSMADSPWCVLTSFHLFPLRASCAHFVPCDA
jgi:hypothetical protein